MKKTQQQRTAKPYTSLAVWSILGIALGFLIIFLDTLPPNWKLTLSLGVIGGSIGLLIFFYDHNKLFKIILALFSLSIPFNLDFVLFYREHAGTLLYSNIFKYNTSPLFVFTDVVQTYYHGKNAFRV